jgi:hypothetical protein
LTPDSGVGTPEQTPKKRLLTAVLALLALALAAPGARAQATSYEPPVRYFRMGIGVGGGSGGLTVGIDATLDRVDRLYRARLTTLDNVAVNQGLEYTPRVTIGEVGLMYGKGHRFSRTYGTLSGGLALVTVDMDESTKATVGVPVEAQLVFGDAFKVGTSLLGNLNAEKPFVALIVSVQFGRMP